MPSQEDAKIGTLALMNNCEIELAKGPTDLLSKSIETSEAQVLRPGACEYLNFSPCLTTLLSVT